MEAMNLNRNISTIVSAKDAVSAIGAVLWKDSLDGDSLSEIERQGLTDGLIVLSSVIGEQIEVIEENLSQIMEKEQVIS